MVVLCLRFRTGTQILIYFPVLLQISSATSGQLLWEKHVKAPKWLMNPSPFTKRGIAADSQREKHMGMLTIAKASPQVTVSVLPHLLPVLSTKKPLCLNEKGCLLNGHGKWAGGGMGGRDQLPSDLLWILLEWSSLSWFPWVPSHGFHPLLNFHWWIISGRGLGVMSGSVQAEDARTDMVC